MEFANESHIILFNAVSQRNYDKPSSKFVRKILCVNTFVKNLHFLIMKSAKHIQTKFKFRTVISSCLIYENFEVLSEICDYSIHFNLLSLIASKIWQGFGF